MIYDDKIKESIIKEFFDTNIIKKNDNLIIALSGGMDSMCLMDVFLKLQSELQFNLYALHVHHGIRGIEADRDQKFVTKYCRDTGIKLYLRKVDAVSFSKKNSLSLEEGARILRYNAFSEIHKELKPSYVLVAHHEKDQIETIIHNIVRGTGIKGLIGIKSVQDYILRPLLYISKDNIIQYIKDNSVPYVNDSTNLDKSITRNFIREEIANKLPIINDKSYRHIIELSRQAKEISDYLDAICEYTFKHVINNHDRDCIIIDNNKFKSLNNLIKSGVIRNVFYSLVKSLKDIGSVHISDIILLSIKEKGGHLDLPYNITLDKKKGELIFKKNKINISMSRRNK